MSGFAIKGWCPSALQPMLSGDGLVLRIRPRCGRLSAAQAFGIAELAGTYGNGLIDLTGRANLQIRGVREEACDALAAALAKLGLIDTDGASEAQRNLLVAPFWSEGDDTQWLATALEQALAATPLGLPQKFGFAVDCGSERVLAQAAADIRIERAAKGGLIVRADGASEGRAVAREQAVPTALSLAKWFATSGGISDGRGRMAQHIRAGAELPRALAGGAKPAVVMAPPKPGPHLTPWRMILVEGLREEPLHDLLVTRVNDPLLRVTACTGAPGCLEARAETRRLAAALAPHVPLGSHLHVSGCAKGCARPGSSNLTLVGTSNGFDLVRDGSARDVPATCGLDPAELLAEIGALMGAR